MGIDISEYLLAAVKANPNLGDYFSSGVMVLNLKKPKNF